MELKEGPHFNKSNKLLNSSWGVVINDHLKPTILIDSQKIYKSLGCQTLKISVLFLNMIVYFNHYYFGTT